MLPRFPGVGSRLLLCCDFTRAHHHMLSGQDTKVGGQKTKAPMLPDILFFLLPELSVVPLCLPVPPGVQNVSADHAHGT